MLLGGDLDEQALAQVAGADAGRVKLLHYFDAAAQQLQRRRLFSIVCGWSEGRSQFFFATGQVPVVVQIADGELYRLVQAGLQGQISQLPRQVIGQSRRLGEKVLIRGLFTLFVLRLCAVTGVQVILEVRSEVDLVKRILNWGRGLFNDALLNSALLIALNAFLAARNLIQHRNRLVNLLQDGIFHHLGIDHLLQLEIVERKHAHHLHQSRSQNLALRQLDV